MSISFDYDFGLKEVIICDMPSGSTVVIDGIEYVPERIVRCRDCEYCDSESELKPGYMYCLYHGSFQDGLDGFCAWGELKVVE